MPKPVAYAVRLLGAAAAGLALWLSFPDHNLWWLAPIGVALLAGVTWQRGFRRGFGLGMFAGWAYFIPALSWSGIYVGAVPWLALATLQALYVAVMSGLVGWGTHRLLGRAEPGSAPGHPTRAAHVWRGTAYLLVPLGWVAQEMARSTTPWGGFPWARLAFSQADSPLVHVAALLGAPGVTLAVAVVGALLLLAAHAWPTRQPAQQPIRRWRAIAGSGAGVALVVGLGGLLTVQSSDLATDGHRVTIGYVQGNVPQAGLDFNAQRRAVLDNHVRETEVLAHKVRTSGASDLSLVAWPENSSDIDPFRNSDAGAQIQHAMAAVDVPVLVGAVLAEPVDHNSNVSLLYRPEGREPERYTKLHPVPFAEYIPYREFFARITPAAHLAGNFVAGDTIGAFHIPSSTGDYWALPTICFEVAYDGLMRDSVTNPRVGSDPSVLIVQTNNATFGWTAESEQQFAISRLRAIEHARSVVHISTVGVSGFIAPDGSVSHKSGLFEPAAATESVIVRSGLTLSDRLGPWPERSVVAAFVVLLLEAARTSLTTRFTRRAAGNASDRLRV